MTAINLDDQIVATSYDSLTRVCSYTYEHTDGSRYTVKIPIDDLNAHGPQPRSNAQRRIHLGQHLQNYIRTNPPDDYEQQRLSGRAVEASNPGGDGSQASASAGEPAAIITGPGFRA